MECTENMHYFEGGNPPFFCKREIPGYCLVIQGGKTRHPVYRICDSLSFYMLETQCLRMKNFEKAPTQKPNQKHINENPKRQKV